MKRLALLTLLLTGASAAFSQIAWTDFETAVARSHQDGKPIMIDVYTDWCGWCKRLDATTYADSAVAAYVNEHFHAVKLNAEHTTTVFYRDSTYTMRSLAEMLLNKKMSYPTTVFITENPSLTAPIPGYLSRENIQPFLFYFGEQVYTLNNTWEIFLKGYNAKKF